MNNHRISKRPGGFRTRRVVWVQGIYYFLTGLWPLLSISAFQTVTGPKTDIWLVKTIGLLLMVCGLVLLLAAIRRRVDLQIVILGIGIALVLIGVEVVYVFNGTISAVYLLDALVEGGFVAGWFFRHRTQ